MYLNIFTIISLLTLSTNILGGFAPDTLVKKLQGYEQINNLESGDLVECYDGASAALKPVQSKFYVQQQGAIKILLSEDEIVASKDQQFYLPLYKEWCEADRLRPGDKLLDVSGNLVLILDVETLKATNKLCDISVAKHHNYFVSKSSVLVHNAIPFVVGATWVIGEKFIEFAGASLVLGGLGFWFNKDKQEDQRLKLQIDPNKFNSGGNKKPNDEKKKKKGYIPPPSKKKQEERVKRFVSESKPGRKTSGKSTQFEKPGDLEKAMEDFYSLDPDNVVPIATGKRGVLKDGRDVNVRWRSEDGRPTLEIFNRNNKKSIKFRYGEN